MADALVDATSIKPHVNVVYMCKLHVNCQFTVNQQFTHRQRLSLHSRSLESYKADYTCKCCLIDVASARASPIDMWLPVYMCKPQWQMLWQMWHWLPVYMCKPQWQMLWQMLCQFNHIYMCNQPCMIPNWQFTCVNLNGRCSGRCYIN